MRRVSTSELGALSDSLLVGAVDELDWN